MKIIVAGAAGRMGKAIIQYIIDHNLHKNFQITAALVMSDEILLGASVNGLEGINYSSDIEAAIAQSDIVIDFTQPASTISLAKVCRTLNKCMVSGVTGFTAMQFAALQEYARDAKIFWAPNMSIGISLMALGIAKIITNLPDEFDIEILEMHHRDKIDSPSGTALYLAETISSASNDKYHINKSFDRQGVKKQNEIGFGVMRGGKVIGEHSVLCIGDSEVISIQHKAHNRDIYVKGALAAAKFMLNQKPGKIYNMGDLINNTPSRA